MANYDDECEDDDDDDDDDGNDDDQESNKSVCCKCVTSGDDSDINGVIDRIEQDIVTAFLCAGCNLDAKKYATNFPIVCRTNSSFSSRERRRRSAA